MTTQTEIPLRPRLPDWLKVRMPGGPRYIELKQLMRDSQLHTVCEEAHCPNIGECWERSAATFMILGDICTRACAYCAVTTGRPGALDLGEPFRLAATVKRMELQYCVITSVNRDDLPDGGAGIFAACIKQVRAAVPGCRVEVLIPDFDGNWDALGEGSSRPAPGAQPQHRVGGARIPPRPPQGRLPPVFGANPTGQGHRPANAHQIRHYRRHGRNDGRSARDHGRPARRQLRPAHHRPVPAPLHQAHPKSTASTPRPSSTNCARPARPWASSTSPLAPSSVPPTMPTSSTRRQRDCRRAYPVPVLRRSPPQR